MADELLKSLIQYFTCVEKCDKNWTALVDKLKPMINELRNQAEQLRAVTSYEADNLEIFKLPGIRDKLISKIIIAATETIDFIKKDLMNIQSNVQELESKLKNVQKNRSNVSLNDANFEEIVRGTPRRPGLDVLLEYALHAYQYYSNLYSNCKGRLMVIDCKDEESLENFAQSFVQDKLQRERIDGVLLYTRFMIEDNRR